MDSGMYVVRRVNPERDLVEEALNFNPRKLDQVLGDTLSEYTIVLSQYLIYFKYQLNTSSVEVRKKKRFIDNTVNQLLTKDLIKQYKTKTDARQFLIHSTKKLNDVQDEIDALQDEVYVLENVDKMIQELIASYKRELTRREHESYSTRLDRRT